MLLMLSISSVAIAQQDDDLVKLRKLNATFIHNFVTNDTASHNKIIHKDFVYISGRGQVVNRKEYLNNWAHGFDPAVITYWDYREENIRLFGSTALVRSMNRYTVVRDGVAQELMSIYTDTYIKEKGEWRCVQAQITPVAKEYYRGDDTVVRKYGK